MAKIVSPCTRICVVDRMRGLCEGCGRSLDEIARWTSLTDAQRRAVMARLAGAPKSGEAKA